MAQTELARMPLARRLASVRTELGDRTWFAIVTENAFHSGIREGVIQQRMADVYRRRAAQNFQRGIES